MKTTRVLAAAAGILAATALMTSTSLAANDFEGVWKVTDSSGQAFEITLGAGGKASANRPGEPMSGTWKAAGSEAVITWDTGWTTKITKDGGKFTKTAYEKGKPDAPVNTSAAEKVK